MYNQYNPEAKHYLPILESTVKVFKSFLYSEEISKGSIRSYVSDARHFLSWLLFFLKSNKIFVDLNPTMKQPARNASHSDAGGSNNETIVLLKYVNPKVLDAYKDYLVSNNIPSKTINRRFSSLRRFGLFCQSQGWLSLNPFGTLRNISLNQPFPEDIHHLAEYRSELWKNNASRLTIKNYLNDIRQFLVWMECSTRNDTKQNTKQHNNTNNSSSKSFSADSCSNSR